MNNILLEQGTIIITPTTRLMPRAKIYSQREILKSLMRFMARALWLARPFAWPHDKPRS